ncbi:hypothetical protein NDA15_002307 [Ustilago hordei]|nr:hypothetical protein NDA15_002307 [Ustilago hordei]
MTSIPEATYVCGYELDSSSEQLEEIKTQASRSRAKGGRRGKAAQSRADNKATNKTESKAPDNDATKETDTDSNLNNAYDKKHPKWNQMLDDALTNALHGTSDTTGKYNVNYLILGIIREYHTFYQVWKKIENGDVKMFNSNAQKLIQEIRSIQMESSHLGKPFANNTLFLSLQKCTIHHPMYKETVTTINQLNFNALATALTTCQSAIKSNPTLKIDPCQASARIAGNNQDKSTKTDEKDKKDDDCMSAKEVWCSFTPSWKRPLDPKETSHWILDSGASYHMVNNYSMLICLRPCQKHVFTAGSKVLEAMAIRDVNISMYYGDVFLQNALYVRHLNVNLLSTNFLMDEGAQVTLDIVGRQIHLANGMLLKIAKDCEWGLLEFQGKMWQESMMITTTPLLEGVGDELVQIESKAEVSKQQLWHEHLGHPGQDKTRAIINKLKGKHIVDLDPDTVLMCKQCIWSKSMVAWMGQGDRHRAPSPLDLIHIDLIIDSSHTTKHMHILFLVDDHSKYICAAIAVKEPCICPAQEDGIVP